MSRSYRQYALVQPIALKFAERCTYTIPTIKWVVEITLRTLIKLLCDEDFDYQRGEPKPFGSSPT